MNQHIFKLFFIILQLKNIQNAYNKHKKTYNKHTKYIS